jgi:hypothetical protein
VQLSVMHLLVLPLNASCDPSVSTIHSVTSMNTITAPSPQVDDYTFDSCSEWSRKTIHTCCLSLSTKEVKEY